MYPYITPRANRTWELAKGFAKRGDEVVVYALTGDRDYGLEEKKYKMKIHNLGLSHCGLIDSQGNGKRTFMNRAIGKIIGEYNAYPGCELYPMIRRCFRRESDIDLLITIAHPHVIHWAASKYINILKPQCWIADCGDPFMGNTFYPPHQIYKRFETGFCTKVDFITVPVDDAIKGYYPQFRQKIKVIPQGFDNSELKLSDYIPNRVPVFAFAGVAYPGLRDPRHFLDYLAKHNIDCRFIVYSDSPEFAEYKHILSDKIEIRNKVARPDLIYEMSQCDFLINISNGTTVQTPSKLIDYSLSKRPILTITSEFTVEDQKLFHDFMKGEYSGQEIVDVSAYEIDQVVNKFVGLFYSLINKSHPAILK